MLHFLIGTALCIFIGERLVRWVSPRALVLLAGSVVLSAVVMGGGYLFLTDVAQAPRPCEMHAITYQELIDRGNSPELAEFKVRTGANVGC